MSLFECHTPLFVVWESKYILVCSYFRVPCTINRILYGKVLSVCAGDLNNSEDGLEQSFWVVFIVGTLYFGGSRWRSEVSDQQDIADRLTISTQKNIKIIMSS